MKRIYFLIIIISISLKCSGQAWEWAKQLNGVGYDKLSVVHCSDGFYLSGQFNDSVKFDNITLISPGLSYFIGRFDNQGNCLWLKKIFYFGNAATDSNDNLYLSGHFVGQFILDDDTLTSSNAAASSAMIVKFSPQGDLLKMEMLDGAYGCGLKINSQDQLILAARNWGTINYKGIIFTDSTGLILKLDSELNLINYSQTSALSYINQLEIAENDTIYLVIEKEYSCMYCGADRILKYSPDLDLLINHFYSGGVGTHYHSTPWIACHGGSVYVMKGEPYLTIYSPLIIEKYNSLLNNKIWEKQLNCIGSIYNLSNTLYAIGSTNGMICTDTFSTSSFITELDTTVTCLWNKALPYFNIFAGFSNDNANNIYMSGFTDNSLTFDSITISPSAPKTAFIAKLKVASTSIEKTDNINSDFDIKPNPSTGNFTIQFTSLQKKAKLSIYNIFGQCILSQLLTESVDTKIDLSRQSKGLYFIELNTDKERTIRKLLLD